MHCTFESGDKFISEISTLDPFIIIINHIKSAHTCNHIHDMAVLTKRANRMYRLIRIYVRHMQSLYTVFLYIFFYYTPMGHDHHVAP